MMNARGNMEQEQEVLYRCHPNRGYGYFWILVLLFIIGMPVKFAIDLSDVQELFWGLLLVSPIIVLSIEQVRWLLFGEEIATIEGENLNIRRTHRFFRQNWSCSLCDIESVGYYEESVWESFFHRRRFFYARNKLCIKLSISQRKYPIAPELGEDDYDWLSPDKVIIRLREAVAAAKERAGIMAEEEYWEAVAEFAENEEDISNE
jgi:hypothetical protein